MPQRSRRRFLQTIAGLAAGGALPPGIARALTLPANRRTGTIADVEHIVVLMQENRSFDHYFGTLRGVRGFGDPRPVTLRSGRSCFHRPTPDGGDVVLPFHMDSATTSGQLIKSLDHSWKDDGAEWADYACWIRHKTPLTMGYFKRADIPYYHALADAFTVGDGYYASVHGPTNPNRMYLFTGTSGLTVGDAREQAVHNKDDGNWTGDAARDKPDFAAAEWTTYAERLQASGVSWKVYQEFDNFGDNSLAYFRRFRGLSADDALHRRGRAIVPGSTAANAAASTAQHLVDAFAADVRGGTLPSVSWIVAPAKYSEHPEAPPALGESLTARIVDALTASPEVWAKTALILNYDENDGFFDHMPGPQPALTPAAGRSTLGTDGESYRGGSVGLGVRVPLIVVSPWTRGGWVDSEVFDHTSVIRFMERRFGVMEPNISAWRRAVAGDLTSMFDFADPDASALRAFPETADAGARLRRQATLPPPAPATGGALPPQEAGHRPARPLPYRLAVDERPSRDGLALSFVNAGAAAAVFGAYSAAPGAGPWFYTVGAGDRIDDTLPGLSLAHDYRVEVHGPNGFLRGFTGGGGVAPGVSVAVDPTADGADMLVRLANRGASRARVSITPRAYRSGARSVALAAGATRLIRYPIADAHHWYDFDVAVEGAHWVRRFAGHVETGRPSRSDPAIRSVAIA